MFSNINKLCAALSLNHGFVFNYDTSGEHLYYDQPELCMSVYLDIDGTLSLLWTDARGNDADEKFTMIHVDNLIGRIVELKKNYNLS